MTRVPASRQRAQLLVPVRNRAAFLDAYFSRGARPGSREGDPITGEGAVVVDKSKEPITQEGVPVEEQPRSAESMRHLGSREGRPVEDTGGMFVPGEIDVELGEEVDAELFFHEEQVRFHIRAVVKWKRTQLGRRSLPPGVGLEFLASEKRTQEQLLRFAEGKDSVSHVDRPRRWSLQVDVRVRDDEKTILGVTDDISEGGCFVITNAQLATGALVEVKLRAPGSLFGWLTVEGFVTWRREQPGRTGVGIELRFANDRQRKAMRKIVDVIRERTMREVMIKVPRVTTPPTSA